MVQSSGFSTFPRKKNKHQTIPRFHSKFAAGNDSDPYALKSLGLNGKLQPSPIFVDVGANLGLVSISLAKQWPSARILALEPAPATFRYLLWNLKENHVASQAQHVHDRAMLDHDGFSRDMIRHVPWEETNISCRGSYGFGASPNRAEVPQ